MRVLHHPDAARRVSQPSGRLDRPRAEGLAARGVKELLLISQDTTFYGIDRQERGALARLLRRLNTVAGLEWIRLLYLYPTTIDDDTLAAMAECDKVCKEHRPAAAARVEPGAEADEAAGHAPEVRPAAHPHPRRACPASRSARRSSSASRARPTADVDELCAFVCDHAFDHVGVFTYSHEEGTSAYGLDNDVLQGTKTKRRDRIMGLQKRLVKARQRRRIGERARVLVDGPAGEHELVLKGAAGDAGARYRRLGIPDRLRPVELPPRRFCRGRDRRRPGLRFDAARGGRHVYNFEFEPGCRTEWACAHFFCLRARSVRTVMLADVVEQVRAIASRVAARYGLEIFDVQFRREAPGMVLRVRIDRPGPGRRRKTA